MAVKKEYYVYTHWLDGEYLETTSKAYKDLIATLRTENIDHHLDITEGTDAKGNTVLRHYLTDY